LPALASSTAFLPSQLLALSSGLLPVDPTKLCLVSPSGFTQFTVRSLAFVEVEADGIATMY
jgi:hypothetical protein